MAQITLNSSGVASNGTLALQSNGTTTAVTIDASQNVGVGTVSPARKFEVIAAGAPAAQFVRTTTATNSLQTNPVVITRTSGNMADGFGTLVNHQIQDDAGVDNTIGYYGFVRNGADNSGAFYVATSNAGTTAERMRIDSGGKVFVGTTADIAGPGGSQVTFLSTTAGRFGLAIGNTAGSSAYGLGINSQTGENIYLYYQGTYKGLVSTAAGGTTYGTTSDYRLKENIAPMQGALEKVAQLKPCTYTWKEDGSIGQGFIAHELQAVIPDAVVGEKDAVDSEGNPQYQNVDTSFLVATLTAAIQEQQAIITSLTDRITALEAK